GRLIAEACSPAADEILVVSQKAVSKVEGRVRSVADVEPGARAIQLAALLDKDPALVELVLSESTRVVRAARGVLITETNQGWICANAGIDSSNLDEGIVSLLPVDGDASAQRIRAQVAAASGAAPAVVVADSFGRAWRMGQADVAIGRPRRAPLDDWGGRRDERGRELTATHIAVADELAAAADLTRDKDSGVPGAIVAGLGDLVVEEDGPGTGPLRRPAEEDLFR